MLTAPRGCGEMKPDSWYIQGDVFSENGRLWSWTNILPSWLVSADEEEALQDRYHISAEFKQRGVDIIDPAGTLAVKYPVFSDWKTGTPFARLHKGDTNLLSRWERHQKHVTTFGIGDYVGSGSYTPYTFAKETAERGVSRNVGRVMAMTIAYMMKRAPYAIGAVPILFSHNDIPLFDHKEQAIECHEICMDI